ncbi:MAG: hypothetical protein ABW217_02350 [Polyangiaceae bacterium]
MWGSRIERSVRRARTTALVVLSLSSLPALAQAPRLSLLPPALSLEPALALPLVPELQLTPPALLAASPAVEPPHTHVPWLSYWQGSTLPREWRDASDPELRVRLETGMLELDDWSLSSGLRTTPERARERECYPNCWGPDWESSLMLKYEVGSLGPLQQTGPLLELQGKPHAAGVRERGLFNIGLGGAF